MHTCVLSIHAPAYRHTCIHTASPCTYAHTHTHTHTHHCLELTYQSHNLTSRGLLLERIWFVCGSVFVFSLERILKSSREDNSLQPRDGKRLAHGNAAEERHGGPDPWRLNPISAGTDQDTFLTAKRFVQAVLSPAGFQL